VEVSLRAGLKLAAMLAVGMISSGCVSSKCKPVEIAPGIFAGCRPETPQDYAALHRQGIRTLLSLETLYCHIEEERVLAAQKGLVYRNIPIAPTPLPPSERHVRDALQTLHDPSLHPIFVHCLIGSDRTTFIAALYRMYYLGWSPEAAWGDMLQTGFHRKWWVYGLKCYFWHHTHTPDWARRRGFETDRVMGTAVTNRLSGEVYRVRLPQGR
jgi:hypothetical protein